MKEFKATLDAEIEKLNEYVLTKESSIAIKQEALEKEQKHLEELKKSLAEKVDEKNQLAEYEKWKTAQVKVEKTVVGGTLRTTLSKTDDNEAAKKDNK